MCAVKIGRLGKFDLNPRGELWCKDQNRFGHKLLSKFGWSQGKGLGKNEDGIAENLKVRMKMGNTGVGWDEKLPIGIDYREYDSVLEDLSKRFQKTSEVKSEEYSLEKRSQQFRNRIHYQKFVRGKDISRYSEKDMSCIFLSREPEKEESSAKETTVTNIESRPTDQAAKESTPTFNSQLSIADYFAMKMKNKAASSLCAPKEPYTCEESSQSETDAKSKKRKQEFKSSKKAKRMKRETELSTLEGNLWNEEESTSESSSSSQESSEDTLICKGQFQNMEESSSERVKEKKKMSKKAKKLYKSKNDIENNLLEETNEVEEEMHEDENSNPTELSTSEGSLSGKEMTVESQEAPEEIAIAKQQFNVFESVKKKKKLSKKAKTLLSLSESKQDLGSNWQEGINVADRNLTEGKSFENQSWEKSCNSVEESINMTEKEVTCKKRKKGHKSCKKSKKRRLEEVKISTPVENDSSHSESNETNSSEECTSKSEKQSCKESKHKNKIFNLKSCLKSLGSNKYSFKQKPKVSFCENISYKIIENVLSNNFDSDVVLETNEQLLSCSDEDCTDSEVQNEAESVGMSHVDDSKSPSESFNGEAQCSCEDVPSCENLDVVEDNTVPECFKLPKPSSSNYDSWLETQRIAARMKVYKNMAKKMKRHPILRKTNLLDIKGYGNWGV